MPGTTPCVPCCSTPQTVNVPGSAGADGAAGTDGSDGVNAFTLTTADFTVPAVGATVTVSVANSTWMQVGQPIYVEGPANFTVSSKPSTTSVILTFQGFEDDVAPTTVISSGAGVSPGGTQAAALTASNLSVYASGTPYTLSAVAAALVFGTISPQLTINEAGTWMLIALVRIDYFFATYGSDDVECTLKLRRTNNTPADITDSEYTFKLRDVSTAYFTAGNVALPIVFYTTTATSDILAIFGQLEAVPDNDPTGSVRAMDASLVAVKVAAS